MLDLIRRQQEHAPPVSLLIVESEEGFDFDELRVAVEPAGALAWDILSYAPEVLGVCRR
jgi:hypothetical protein